MEVHDYSGTNVDYSTRLKLALTNIPPFNRQEMQPYAEPTLHGSEGDVSVILPSEEVKGLRNVVRWPASACVPPPHVAVNQEHFTGEYKSTIIRAASLKSLWDQVERMKSMSEYLLLTAIDGAHSNGQHSLIEGAGQLKLQVEKDHLVSVTTTYPKLDVPKLESRENLEVGLHPQPARYACAKVEVKRLLRILQSLGQHCTRQSTPFCMSEGLLIVAA